MLLGTVVYNRTASDCFSSPTGRPSSNLSESGSVKTSIYSLEWFQKKFFPNSYITKLQGFSSVNCLQYTF